MTVSDSSPQPTHSWKVIRAELLKRIQDRVWQPGDLIPGESDLAAEFGCARTTVNRALRDLAESGLVERKRKAGTRVTINPPQKATLTIPILREQVEQRGCSYRHSLLIREQRQLPVHLHAAFQVKPDDKLIYTETLHYADDRPFVHEKRFTNGTAVPDIETAAFDDVTINEWLVQHTPYTSGEMTFFATEADEILANYFETRAGTALFATDRSTFDGLTPITHVRLVYAPGYRMRTQL